MEQFRELKVLIVDDDLAFLDLIAGLLRSLGIKTVERADSRAHAAEFLAALKSPIDCIICDIAMLGGNGLQLLKEVRCGGFKYVRLDATFMLLTAVKHPAAIKVASQLDVNGYLTKPVSVDALRDGIAKARARVFALDFARYKQVAIPGPTA